MVFQGSSLFFCGFMSVFTVFQGYRLDFQCSRWILKVFHGSRLVFIDPGPFSMVLGGFFMAPGGFLWFFRVPGWIFMIIRGILW